MTDAFFANLTDPQRFRAAIEQFDALNSRDPNTEAVNGVLRPRELVFAERLSDWVMKLSPAAPETSRLASRCQHLCRWEIPRDRYEMTRAGYHQWKNTLKRFHAEKSADVLRAVGYDDVVVQRVQALNLKKDFPKDSESRVIEDALCLVFLQFQFAPLAAKTDDEKLINALQKSWNKMTEEAREHALKLPFGARETSLIQRALSGA
jgi:hypothetical protein